MSAITKLTPVVLMPSVSGKPDGTYDILPRPENLLVLWTRQNEIVAKVNELVDAVNALNE